MMEINNKILQEILESSNSRLINIKNEVWRIKQTTQKKILDKESAKLIKDVQETLKDLEGYVYCVEVVA